MTLRGLIKSNKVKALLIFILLIGVAALNTVASYLFKPATDYLVEGNLNLSLIFFVIMISAGIISIVLDSVTQIMYSHQVQDYIGIIRQKMVVHFYKQNDHTLDEMQNNLGNNLDILLDNYATPILTIINNSLTLIFTIGVLFQLNWTFVVLTAILAVINLLTPRIMENATDKANKKISVENSKLLKTINYWLGGIQELRRYNSFTSLFKTMNEADKNFEDSNIHSAKINSFSSFISNLANVLSQIIISLWAGVLFFQGKMTIGAALVVGNFVSQIFSAVWIYEQAITQFNSIKSINQETKDLKKDVVKNTVKLNDDLAELEIKNVSFKYNHGELIQYPNIKIKRGEKVLLTGDSGTGKSTLFKLILGKLKPYSGTLIFKDSVGDEIDPDLSKIGYIAQDSTFFPDTIKNNITMFDSTLNDEVENYVEKVQLKNDILKFANGLDTVINLDTGNLSGGQKQKIVLARSQIHKSKFVLMDEATSAIDSQATKKILDELLKSNMTLILIAHNFNSSLRAMFDREIHLKKGEKDNDD